MNNKRYSFELTVFILILMLLFPVAALAERGVSKTEIKLGFIGDITGPTVVVQKPYLDGVKNYFRYVNENGGINGRTIKLIPEDDQYQASKAVAGFKKLVSRDKVLAIVGPTGSTSLKALYSQIEKHKVPCIGPMSTTDDMLKPFKRYIFTIMSTYQDQAKVIVDFIVKDLKGEKPRIALVTQDNEPGKVVAASVKTALKAQGTDLVTTVKVPFGAMDATSQVLLLKKANPNFVIVQGNIGIAIAVLKDAKKLGFNSKFIGTFSTFAEPTYMKAGDAAKNFVGVHSVNSWYDEDPGLKKLREITLKYEPGTADKVRSRYYVQGWVTATILAEGLKRAGKNLNGESLVNALESIRGFDTKGLCGPISYSASSHKGLEFVRVYTCKDFKSAKLIPITGWMKGW